jgi:predicted AlkP superfamily pyrophosphatase or phosphodiesterase
MGKQKLLLFCIDALCSSDLPLMRTLPNFSRVFENASLVTHIEPSYPSLTYVCHASILTGKTPEGHGIFHNEHILRGGHLGQSWFCMREDMKAKTLLDYAAERGMSTCSLSWPVTGAAGWDYTMPMIVPYNYTAYHPETYLQGTASEVLLENYFWKYGRFQKGTDRSLDLYTMALAPDIIRDFGQPDVMLVKMCDLDSVRHTSGVYGEPAEEQLRKHDQEFGVLLESVRRYGDYDATNFVILGDHGQSDTEDVVHMNVLLEKNGFLQTDGRGALRSFDALCHSAGFSAFIELGDPGDSKLHDRVYHFLTGLGGDPRIKLEYVFTAGEARARFGLTGPFDFVIESSRRVAFSEALSAGSIYGEIISGDHKVGSGNHGGLPFMDETTTFIASGPAVRRGIVLDRRPMVDEASTMARMLGFEMDDTDGTAMTELLY